MKTIIVTFVLACMTLTVANAQTEGTSDKKSKKKIAKAEVPKSVVETFKIRFPKVEMEDWYSYPYYLDYISSDSIGTVEYFYPEYYDVEYIYQGNNQRSVFSRQGKLQATYIKLKPGELPKAVSDTIKNSSYSDWIILDEKEKIMHEDPKQTLYKIIVKKDRERHVLIYDQNGKLIQGKKYQYKLD